MINVSFLTLFFHFFRIKSTEFPFFIFKALMWFFGFHFLGFFYCVNFAKLRLHFPHFLPHMVLG